jgi:hypothetical protein
MTSRLSKQVSGASSSSGAASAHVRAFLFGSAALFALAACDIAEGPKDLANDVFAPSRFHIDSPGTRLVTGVRLSVRSDPTRTLLMVWNTEDRTSGLTVLNPATHEKCSAGSFSDFKFMHDLSAGSDFPSRIALRGDVDEQGRGSLRFLDAHCAELGAPLEHAEIPQVLLSAPPRYLLQDGDDLVTVDATTGVVTRLAEDVSWYSAITTRPGFASPLRFVQLVSEGRYQLLGPTGELLTASGADASIIVPNLAEPLSALLVLEGERLSRADLAAPYLVPLADDVCDVSPLSDPRIPVVRSCSGETQFLRGRLPQPDPVAIADDAVRVGDAPRVSLAIYTRAVSSERVNVGLLDSMGTVSPVLEDVVFGSDLWRPTPLGTSVEVLTGADSTLVRQFIGGARLSLATGVYRWPQPRAELPLIDRFDGVSGRWVEIQGLEAPVLSVVAEGVVPDGGFAPAPSFAVGLEDSALSVHGYFAFLRDFHRGVGELVVAHRPAASSSVLRVGWALPLASAVAPRSFRWAFDGAILLYISDWDTAARSGVLHSYRPDLDLDQIVARGVVDFTETSSPLGVAYVVAEGDDAGVWHARLK